MATSTFPYPEGTTIDQVSNVKAIKDYFGMSAKDTMAETKLLTDEDKQQLGDAIRSGKLSY